MISPIASVALTPPFPPSGSAFPLKYCASAELPIATSCSSLLPPLFRPILLIHPLPLPLRLLLLPLPTFRLCRVQLLSAPGFALLVSNAGVTTLLVLLVVAILALFSPID